MKITKEIAEQAIQDYKTAHDILVTLEDQVKSAKKALKEAGKNLGDVIAPLDTGLQIGDVVEFDYHGKNIRLKITEIYGSVSRDWRTNQWEDNLNTSYYGIRVRKDGNLGEETSFHPTLYTWKKVE